MRSSSPDGGYGDGGYGRSTGGYGRPKPKAKPPSLAQLEERNSRKREENTLMQDKLGDFEEQHSKLNVCIAQLSGELGSLTGRAQRLEQNTKEKEWKFADMMQELDVELGTLCEERDAWQRRIKGFATAANETDEELADLDELASRGVQERRKLQSECLSLQQECEDARVELQETRDLLAKSGNTVEKMMRQKLDLEWELQEQTSKHKVLRTMLQHAGHELAHEADEAYRQRETLVAASRIEIDRERATAESFRAAAINNQREVTAMTNERVRLEREAAAHEKEMQRLEVLRRQFEEEALQENRREGSTKEVLDTCRKRHADLSEQLLKLEMECRDGVNLVADMHEEQTKHLLGKAQRQAQKVLAA